MHPKKYVIQKNNENNAQIRQVTKLTLTLFRALPTSFVLNNSTEHKSNHDKILNYSLVKVKYSMPGQPTDNVQNKIME